jgi:hypothetical protein
MAERLLLVRQMEKKLGKVLLRREGGDDSFEARVAAQRVPIGIIRFLASSALSPDEAINRSPISAAKFFERFLCCRRFTLCREHHTPMRCGKRNDAILRIRVRRPQ